MRMRIIIVILEFGFTRLWGQGPWGGFHSIKHRVPGGLAGLGPSGRSQNIVFYGMDCKVGQFHSIKHRVPGALDSQMYANPGFYRSGWRTSPEYDHKASVFVEVAGTLDAQMAVRWLCVWLR